MGRTSLRDKRVSGYGYPKNEKIPDIDALKNMKYLKNPNRERFVPMATISRLFRTLEEALSLILRAQ